MGIVVKEKHFPSSTGICEVYYRIWAPAEPRACVQIIHGMAEHIDRYHDFATFLAENDILVFGMDLPGHGKSVGKDQPLGYFGESNGWDHLIQDNKTMHDAVMKDYPSVACILFGHSMGTLVARSFLKRHEDEIVKVALTGCPSNNKAVGVAIGLSSMIMRFKGEEYRSPLLNNLCFGAFNKAIANPKTAYDWLSINEDNVQKYIADEDCGYTFTARGFKDMFEGMQDVYKLDGWNVKLPDLPIRFYSGSEDPCMTNLDGLKEAVEILKQQGYKDVDYKVYEGYRHEILNEEIRDQVIDDILAFFNK